AGRAVPARRRQRAPFVLLVVGLLCGGLVSLLLLNTVLAQDSITASRLRGEIAAARQHNERLKQLIEQETQADVIARRAEDQGLHLDNTINPLTLGDKGTGTAAKPATGTGTGADTATGKPGATAESGTGTGGTADTGATTSGTADSTADSAADTGADAGRVGQTR
ncbi:hypothetical protein ABZS51_35200, partial [Nonomuraea sp. NPDC005501]